MNTLVWIIVFLIAFAIIVAVIARFYQRATNEMSLVKTGFGGRRVMIDGGTLAIPYFHEITKVNMQTQRLDIQRKGEASLITKDRMRVDVGAQFYISVMPNQDAIARAAQTLGNRTYQPDHLYALFDGMLVDALHSVAAQMTMDELHENRSKFVADVLGGLKDVLERYGLQLESVSLTALDQTPFSSLDENNAFNAVGMRKLAEVIAKSKKERAEIDADAEISVRKTELAVSRQRLDFSLEERRAEIAQQQEIEILSAAQIAEIAQRKAESESSAAMARIEMDRSIQTAEIEREQSLEIAEQERHILVSAKSEEESKANVKANRAKIDVEKSTAEVQSAREIAEAERRSKIALIASKAEAEMQATRAAIAANSEKATAKDKAAARLEEGEATKVIKIGDAEANKARIEAENLRSDALIAMELEKARLEAMPKIVSEMVKPAEKINSININHLTGGGFGGSSSNDGGKPVVNQVLDSIMEMAVQLPMLKKVGDSIGLNFEDGTSGLSDDEKDKK